MFLGTSPVQTTKTSPGASLAWFAGIDQKRLELVPSVRTFYSALGAYTLFIALFSGTMMSLAVSGMSDDGDKPSLLWGAGWALGILILDRLMLQGVTRTSKGQMALSLLWRFGLVLIISSIVAAGTIQVLFHDRIEAEVTLQNTKAAGLAEAQVEKNFDPAIKSAEAELLAIHGAQASLTRRVHKFDHLATCASTASNCNRLSSPSRYAAAAAATRATLTTRRAEHTPRIESLNARLKKLRKGRADALGANQEANASNTGWVARTEALARIEDGHPVVGRQLFLFAVGLVLLELAGMIAKTFHVLRGCPYDELACSERARDGVTSHEMNIDARYARKLAEKRARASYEADSMAIDDALDGMVFGESGWPVRDGRTTRPASFIEARSLSEYSGESGIHEREKVDVPRDLRRGALIASAIGASLVALIGAIWVSGHGIRGGWIVVGGAVALVALAIQTEGFRRASSWGLQAMFGSLLAAMALPVVLVLLNI